VAAAARRLGIPAGLYAKGSLAAARALRSPLMSYYPNFSSVRLEEIERRLVGADLIPSQVPLLQDLASNLKTLRSAGLKTVQDLREALKGKKGPGNLACLTGIPLEYLILLRRTVESFLPKPVRIRDYAGIDPAARIALGSAGIADSPALFEEARTRSARRALGNRTGLSASTIMELLSLADLSRIPYVGATFARIILEAGYGGVAAVARADPVALDARIREANARLRLYKGKIGLRDIRRLVRMAGDIADEAEW